MLLVLGRRCGGFGGIGGRRDGWLGRRGCTGAAGSIGVESLGDVGGCRWTFFFVVGGLKVNMLVVLFVVFGVTGGVGGYALGGA